MSPRLALRAASSALLLTLLLACGEGAAREERTAPQIPLVEAIEARSGALPIEETMPGVVRARNQVAIRPELAGRIVEVPVRIGEAVERGRLLVRLDASEAEERLRQAEADVSLAKAGAAAATARVLELEARVTRTRTLAEQRLVSAQELETLEAQLAATRANADEAAARVAQSRAAVKERSSALAKTVVRAPVSGRVGERRAEVGMQVDPSSVLFVVGDLDELIIEVNLTEAMLATVEEGLPVSIVSRAAAGEPIRAEISRISPFLAAESFTTTAEIDVDNRGGKLWPGMFVDVRVLVGESRQATLVPVSAVWEDAGTGRSGVFEITETDGLETASGQEQPRAVAFRPVDVRAEGGGVAGVSGIGEGAWVVTIGQQLLASELRAATAGADPASGAAGPAITARVRPISWERLLDLQDLQDEDLLEGFLDKQRKVAAALGSEIPESEDVVDRVLQQAAAPAAPPGG